MTEEIIIDGVDVAGCRHCMYKGFKAFPQCRLELDSFTTACTQHKECEYKQLKRLEFELKVTKADYEASEQENKELKEMYRLSCLKCEYKNTKADVEKYRSALEKIKHILEIHKDELEECLHNDIDGLIIKKIDEVLNEN